jgi:hypothetical protein
VRLNQFRIEFKSLLVSSDGFFELALPLEFDPYLLSLAKLTTDFEINSLRPKTVTLLQE